MQRRSRLQVRQLLLDTRWQRLDLDVITFHMLMLVAESQNERGLVMNGNGWATLLIVVTTLPVLQVATLFVPEETKAIDYQ